MQAITLGAIGVAAAAEFYDRSTDKVQILCRSFALLESQCNSNCNACSMSICLHTMALPWHATCICAYAEAKIVFLKLNACMFV